MDDRLPTVLDYSDHVEFGGRETDGARGFSWPTDAEVIRCWPWAQRFTDPKSTLTVVELAELGRVIQERYEMHALLSLSGRCPFCDSDLAFVCPSGQPIGHDISFRVCDRCGWWREEDFVDSADEWIISRQQAAVLRRFSLDSPVELIRTHLSKHTEDSRWLHPKRLEDLVGQIFSDFLDCEVLHVGGGVTAA